MIGVKICGVCRPEDAAVAREAGATHVGVILEAGGPRRRSAAEAEAIFAAAGTLARVGVFADAAAERTIELARDLRLSVVQLHGGERPEVADAIADAGPWEVWKAVRPVTPADLDAALTRWEGRVSALLVDGASPGALGGTGVRAPMAVLAAAGERWPLGLVRVLAGGLTPENVADAVILAAPDIVDVSSGVESQPGRKDAARVRAFVAAAREARRPPVALRGG